MRRANQLQFWGCRGILKNASGQKLWVLVNAKHFYENGIPVKAMAVVHNISEIRNAQEQQKRLEKKLQNAQKLESLGTLAWTD
jgi:hypothetical protein